MNAKHTPGPWSEFGPGNPQVYGGDPVRRIAVLDRQTGASMDECYANARLIAAAPELLAALEGVRDFWAGGDCPEDLWEELTTAIAKAKGKA